MTIDEIAEKLEDIENELRHLANTLENIDTSDLSSEHRHFVRQAIKLSRTAGRACEEASQYLNFEDN